VAWLVGALGLSLLFAWRTMAPAFRAGDWVQDDARQHVFWMLRFRDPELFPNDLLADYFQSIAPPGYTALYWSLSWIVDPLLASKLVPFVLAAIFAVFVFLLVRALYPSAAAAFLCTVLASWYVWQYDDLASGSPRSFVLPCVAAVLWALASGRWPLAVLFTVLGGLFYPIAAVIALGLMATRLVVLAGRRPALSRDRAAWLHVALAAALVTLSMLPDRLASSPFGPAVTADEARRMPEFGEDGRTFFFLDDPYQFWVAGYRSGLNLRVHDKLFGKLPILAEYAAAALLLVPVLLARRWLSTARGLGPAAALVAQLLVVSFALFCLSHAVLFRLYLPSRYVQWTVPLALSIAGGLAVAVLLREAAERAWRPRAAHIAALLTVAVAVGLAIYPADYDGIFLPDHHPTITAYLRGLPKDVLIAAPAVEADSIPSFTGRSVLAAREHANPYDLGYYREVRQRLADLVEAYYAPSTDGLLRFADRYGVDYFVVKRAAFNRQQFGLAWTEQFEPFQSRVSDKLRGGNSFALEAAARQCGVAVDGEITLVATSCLRAAR
jgi:hypothetical protein